MRVEKGKLDNRSQKYYDEAERFIVKVYDEKQNLIDLMDSNVAMIVANCEESMEVKILGKGNIMDLAKICLGAKHLINAIEKDHPEIKLLTKLGQMAIKEEEQS